ncbi:MAG: hypothetical protein ACYDC7_06115 [Acidithiobacillus ferrivorans]
MRRLASLLAAPALLLGLALLGYWYYHREAERQEALQGMENAVWRNDWRMVRDTLKDASDVSVSDHGRVLSAYICGGSICQSLSFYFRNGALWENTPQFKPFIVLPHAQGAFFLRDGEVVDCRLILNWPGQRETSWREVLAVNSPKRG